MNLFIFPLLRCSFYASRFLPLLIPLLISSSKISSLATSFVDFMLKDFFLLKMKNPHFFDSSCVHFMLKEFFLFPYYVLPLLFLCSFYALGLVVLCSSSARFRLVLCRHKFLDKLTLPHGTHRLSGKLCRPG